MIDYDILEVNDLKDYLVAWPSDDVSNEKRKNYSVVGHINDFDKSYFNNSSSIAIPESYINFFSSEDIFKNITENKKNIINIISSFPSPVDTDFLLNVDYLQAKILSRQIISGELILAHYFFSHAKFNSFRNHRFLYLVTSNQANMLKKDVSDLKSSGLLKEILDNTNKNYETMPSLKNYYETFFPVKLSLDTLSDAKFVGSVEAHVSSFLNTVYSGRMYNFFTFPPRIRLYEKGFGRFF